MPVCQRHLFLGDANDSLLCLLCISRIHFSPIACHWPNTNMEKDKIIRFSILFAIFCRSSPANLFDRKLSMDSIKVLSERNTWKSPRGESTDHLWLQRPGGLASTTSSSNKCAEFKFYSNGIQFSDWLLKLVAVNLSCVIEDRTCRPPDHRKWHFVCDTKHFFTDKTVNSGYTNTKETMNPK